MYIQSYHVDNVLKEYRNRLCKSLAIKKNHDKARSAAMGNVQLLETAHRQAIIDQVSSKIVEQITASGFQSKLKEFSTMDFAKSEFAQTTINPINESQLSYTAIDENNRKLVHTFTGNEMEPSIAFSENSDTNPAPRVDSSDNLIGTSRKGELHDRRFG